ncbi:MAG: hypothetical protein ACLVL7_13915 [Anaerotruncus massiliensis (ex Togo et al. 2019)]
MIYVTGDVHADLGRFKGKAAKKLKKGDTLIVCGDFGFVWDGSKKEQRVLKWLGKRRYSVLFVEGTHDNLDLLAGYPVVDFCGGKARQISGKCHQLLRGEIYTIESDEVFTLGRGRARFGRASPARAGGRASCPTRRSSRTRGRTWRPAATSSTTSSPIRPPTRSTGSSTWTATT